MAEDSVESSANALVSLKAAGKGTTYTVSSPRRGNPPRIRKKNRLFFNDDEETSYSPIRSPRKQSKPAASTTRSQSNILSGPDKKLAQAIGVRLKNLLKLPKAHKWVCYEYFYSNLDIPLFKGENDFNICLQETFPQLKCKKMRRVEWCKARRLMGKPRRCSAAFFAEERASLEQRRNKIRLLQQRKLQELTSFKDLPQEIPMHLVIGTKVTARLRRPQDGLFTGSVEALDTVSNSYRVTFDKTGLGTHSIPDYEVLSNSPQETIPLSAFQQKHRPTRPPIFSPPKFVPGLSSPDHNLHNDPLLSGSPFKGRLMSLEGGTYGGFPIKFLVLVTRLSKILAVKKDCIKQLRDMNTQVEKLSSEEVKDKESHSEFFQKLIGPSLIMEHFQPEKKSHQQPISLEFQRKYAGTVLELEKLNDDLNEYLLGVQNYCQELAPDQGICPIDQPAEIRRKCEEEAQSILEKISPTVFPKRLARNQKALNLIEHFTSLMLQIRTIGENEVNSFEFKSVQDSVKEIKASLDANNINCFQNNVEIHINHIQSGLIRMGNLHAFSSTFPV